MDNTLAKFGFSSDGRKLTVNAGSFSDEIPFDLPAFEQHLDGHLRDIKRGIMILRDGVKKEIEKLDGNL